MSITHGNISVTPRRPTISDHSLEEQNAHFTDNGYMVLRQAFSPEEVTLLRKEALWVKDQAQKNHINGMRYWYPPKGSCKRKDLPTEADSNSYSWGINEITRPELFRPHLINALANPNVDRVLNALLYQPRVWGLKLLWASQNSHYNLNWHRDLSDKYNRIMPYKPRANDHIQFNAALEKDNSFIVVPGSHRRAMLDEERKLIEQDATAKLPNELRVDLEPGDIVIMDAHAIHRGEAAQGAPRLSLHYSCQANWVPLRPWGEADHFKWICSEEFRNQLAPLTRPYYERLVSPSHRLDTADPYCYLEDIARANGFEGEL